MASESEILEQIRSAADVGALEQLRVSVLGKSGSITARLKSLGSMDPDARAAEAPKIHALREEVTSAIAQRKAALEAAELDRKLATETLDLSLQSHLALETLKRNERLVAGGRKRAELVVQTAIQFASSEEGGDFLQDEAGTFFSKLDFFDDGYRFDVSGLRNMTVGELRVVLDAVRGKPLGGASAETPSPT